MHYTCRRCCTIIKDQNECPACRTTEFLEPIIIEVHKNPRDPDPPAK